MSFGYLAGAVRDDHRDHNRFVAILGLELFFGGIDELVIQLILDEVYRAAAETATHDAGTGHATLAGDVVEVVEFDTADLIVFRQAVMCLIHLLADSLHVALDQGVADIKDTLLLLYDIFGAEVIFGSDVAADAVEHLHRGVTQGLYTEGLGHTLAALAAFVVGGVDQSVLYFGVKQYELVSVSLEGEVFKLHRAAIKAHEVVLLAEYGSELVHDSAVHSAVIVFGRLADAGELEFVYRVAIEKVVEGESEAALKSGGGRQACAKRHIPGEHGVETFDFTAALDDLTAYAEDVTRPLLGRSVFFFQAEFCVFVYINREDTYLLCGVGSEFGHYDLVYGAGEDEPAIVIGMFANEVYTTGRGIHCAILAEFLLKDGVDFLLHEIIKVIS